MWIEEAITTRTATIELAFVTVIMTMPTVTKLFAPHSNTSPRLYVLRNIYNEVLVLKRFVPSIKGKKESVKYVLVNIVEYMYFTKI